MYFHNIHLMEELRIQLSGTVCHRDTISRRHGIFISKSSRALACEERWNDRLIDARQSTRLRHADAPGPTTLAARARLSIVAAPLSGSRRRSTWARLVFISCAMRFLVILFFFISAASWRAITDLIAAAVTSSRMPSSSSQLSKLEPMYGFFLATTAPLSIFASRAPMFGSRLSGATYL